MIMIKHVPHNSNTLSTLNDVVKFILKFCFSYECGFLDFNDQPMQLYLQTNKPFCSFSRTGNLNMNTTILKPCNFCEILLGIREIVISGVKILCDVMLISIN